MMALFYMWMGGLIAISLFVSVSDRPFGDWLDIIAVAVWPLVLIVAVVNRFGGEA